MNSYEIIIQYRDGAKKKFPFFAKNNLEAIEKIRDKYYQNTDVYCFIVYGYKAFNGVIEAYEIMRDYPFHSLFRPIVQ